VANGQWLPATLETGRRLLFRRQENWRCGNCEGAGASKPGRNGFALTIPGSLKIGLGAVCAMAGRHRLGLAAAACGFGVAAWFWDIKVRLG